MNVEQLERVRAIIKNIRAELQTDNEGTSRISEAVGELWGEVTSELRNEVWKRYKKDSE